MAIKLFEALAEPSGTRWQIELPSNFPSFNYLRSSADFVMRLVSITLLLLCLIAGTAKSFAADQVLRIDLGEGQVIELVLVKHGSFVQGSPTSEKSREDDELQHKVTLTKDFYISKTPITVGQFRRFVAETKYRTEAESGSSGGFGLVGDKDEQRPELNWKNPGYPITDQHPVSIITVADAIAFNEWLSKKAGRVFQLPSESQWEFACRGGTQTRFYSGDADADLDEIAWYKKNTKTPMPVAQKKPNSLGLYDMCGNVYQWCGDVYAPYSPQDATDPQNKRPSGNEPVRIVLRGGSFMRDANRCRSAERYRATAGTRHVENGIRIVSIVTEPSSEVAKLLENSPKAKPSEPASNAPANAKPTQGQPQDNAPNTRQNSNTANSTSAQQPAPKPEAAAPTSQPESVSGHGNLDDSHATTVHQSNQVSGVSRLGFLCAVFFAFFLVVVAAIVGLILFTRPRQPNTAEPPVAMGGVAFAQPAGPIRTANDGFWLHTASYVTGSIVFYHYFTSGLRQDGSVVVNPGGQQFVYTGNTPVNVAIDRVEEPEDNINTPYTGTQQDNWNQFNQYSNQHSRSQSHSNPSTSSPNPSTPEQPSPDRELLSDNKSSSFPPAY